VERERLFAERRGQKRRVVLERVEGQVLLPGVERLARDERRDPGDRARMPDHELGLRL
jgi:hypothetical protein